MTKKKGQKKNDKNKTQNVVDSTVIPSSITIDKGESDNFIEDDDLSISDSDIENLTSFICTTNKSFKNNASLMIKTFKGRCMFGIGMVLTTMYQQQVQDDKLSRIKRLNIIYLISKLDEIEPQLRVSQQKTTMQKVKEVEMPCVFEFFLISVAKSDKEQDAYMANLLLKDQHELIQSQTVTEFIDNFNDFSSKFDNDSVISRGKTVDEDYFFLHDTIPVSTFAIAAERDEKDVEECFKYIYDTIEPFSPSILPSRHPLLIEDFLDKNVYEAFVQIEKENSQLVMEEDKDITKNLEDLFSELAEAAVSFETVNNCGNKEENVQVALDKFLEKKSISPRMLKNVISFLEVLVMLQKDLDNDRRKIVQKFVKKTKEDDEFVRICLKSGIMMIRVLILAIAGEADSEFDRLLTFLEDLRPISQLLLVLRAYILIEDELNLQGKRHFPKLSVFVKKLMLSDNVNDRESAELTEIMVNLFIRDKQTLQQAWNDIESLIKL